MKSLKKLRMLSLALFSLIYLFPLISAEIIVGQTEDTYNVGNDFNITISVFSSTYSSGFFLVSLICSENEVEIYKTPLSLDAGKTKDIFISTGLGNFLVQGQGGNCLIRASYNRETAESRPFEITRGLETSLNVVGVVFSPGEKVKVNGEAKKIGGTLLKGFVEIGISSINFTYSEQLTEGTFDFEFVVPKNARSGSYDIESHVYEKDSFGEIMNEGFAVNTIKIRQVTKDIGIALNKQTFLPGESVEYSAVVYDQAGEEADVDVALTFLTPDNVQFKKELIRSGETGNFKTETNYSPGYWKIEAKLNNLQKTRGFFVEEFRKLDFNLQNQTLTLTNIGNVPYTNVVEISIGGIIELKDIKNLPVGESKRFKLAAPIGEYEIKVGEGENVQELGTAFLTGKAISIDDANTYLYKNFFILLAILIILVIAIVALILFRKFFRRKSFRPSGKPAVVLSAKKESSSLIDRGQKQESVILSLKIKNLESLKNSEALKTIDSALWRAKESSAKIYSDGNYRIAVFSHVLTKEKDNSLRAMVIALDMERILKAYNKRSSPKIDFGIGVNIGNLAVEEKNGKFKFMSLDNTLASAKRISEESKAEALISEGLRRKVAGKIKVAQLSGKNLYRVEKVIDRSMHQGYIKKLNLKNHESKK